MSFKLNQKGFTLVELLAAIILFSIVALVLWRFFFQTIDYSNKAISENRLQQEANIILNKVQQMHTQNTISEITITSNPSKLTIKSDKETVVFNNSLITYNATNYTTQVPASFNFTLELTSTNNPSVKFQTKTTFRKLTAK